MAEASVGRVWDLMESIRFCMLATWDGARLHARPMGAFVRREENAICFLADVRRHKDDEIRAFPKVCVSFADPDGQKYASVSGRAAVSNDRQRIRELWSIPAKIWWDSPDDPNIRVITVTPDEAEYWDSPGTIISNLKMAVGLATGTHPEPGDHRRLAREGQGLKSAQRGAAKGDRAVP
jgi:general stress protein 26